MTPKCIRADIEIVLVKSGNSNLSYFIFFVDYYLLTNFILQNTII